MIVTWGEADSDIYLPAAPGARIQFRRQSCHLSCLCHTMWIFTSVTVPLPWREGASDASHAKLMDVHGCQTGSDHHFLISLHRPTRLRSSQHRVVLPTSGFGEFPLLVHTDLNLDPVEFGKCEWRNYYFVILLISVEACALMGDLKRSWLFWHYSHFAVFDDLMLKSCREIKCLLCFNDLVV